MATIIFRQDHKYKNVYLVLKHAVKSDHIPRLGEYVSFREEYDSFRLALKGICKEIMYGYASGALDVINIELELKNKKNEHLPGYELDYGNYHKLSFVSGTAPNEDTHLVILNPSKLMGNDDMEKQGFFHKNEDGSLSDIFDPAQFDAVFPSL